MNIATYCEGHKIDIPANNSLFFRIAAFFMWLVSQFSHNHDAAGKSCISHQVQQFSSVLTAQAVLSTTCGGSTTLSLFLQHVFLNAPTWQAARNAPHINIDSRAVPVMDASSEVLTTLFAVS